MKTNFLLLTLILVFSATGSAAPPDNQKAACSAAFGQLLPAPREVEAGAGCASLGPSIQVSVPQEWTGPVGRYLWLLNEVLEARGARPATVAKQSSAATLRVINKAQGGQPESGYELKIADGVELTASQLGGVFNGLATLAQLIEISGSQAIELPRGRIRDWPEVPTRAVHIDMTCQQYKPAYVQRLMRTLARYKVNAILMEYSDMFPFREHKAIRRPDAFTEEDVKAIRRTAEECNQEIIPFLQTAGHLEYVLTREPYAHLSEGHSGYSYCLANEEVVPFAESLIDEILAQHPGLKRLHVGGDEVMLGTCKRCAAAGDFRAIYLKHNARVIEYCRKKGVVPLLWTDIIAPFKLQDKPDEIARLVQEAGRVLPHEVVGVDWRYDGKGFFVASKMRNAGFQAFTAPAARNHGDLFDLPRVSLHLENVRDAFLRAAEWKLLGTIVTSWSYRGSPHEVCLPSYASAAYGWNTHETDSPALLARFFEQRYGLDESDGKALAKSAIDETKEAVPTTLGIPELDVKNRAWTIPASKQADQLISRMKNEADPKRLAASLESQLGLFTANDRLWKTAVGSAKRHQSELRSWDLSRRHLQHRLRLTAALARSKGGANVDQQLRSLIDPRAKMRAEWQQLYRDVYTPVFMDVDLNFRFDAEPGIIEAVAPATERTSAR